MRFQNNRVLLHVLDHKSGQAVQLTLPEGFESNLNIAAHTLVDGTVVMGTTDNRLFSGTLDLGSAAISDVVELDEKHRSPVTEIVSDGAGSIITCSSSEPLAHVWKYADRKWIYDTNLTGTQKNLMDVSSLAVNKVLGVDENGEAILWNVERQKQRAKLERQAGGQIVKFNAPLRDVIAGGSDGTALAIDANGVVDRWNLVDGSSERIDAERWSYFGHTPGAELVDNAIDLERGVVITVARLRNADKRYLADASHDWSFVYGTQQVAR